LLIDFLDVVFCPLCRAALDMRDGALRCASGHSFDVAKQGYVNLSSGGAVPVSADTAEMVQARDEFLNGGQYRPLAELIAGRAADYVQHGLVVDAGAGTGYYLRAVLERIPYARGLALDISKFALRRAARAHPRLGALVWDVWRPLPVHSGVAAVVLNVFAPRNPAEFRRILARDGALLVVTPTSAHLRELVLALGLLSVDERKEERLADALAPHFRREHCEEHACELRLSHAEVETLARMGPSAHHIGIDELRKRIAGLPPLVAVTASFTLSVYRPLP
jgi:23S rRNA (guanine745-N1)-methyltransferase